MVAVEVEVMMGRCGFEIGLEFHLESKNETNERRSFDDERRSFEGKQRFSYNGGALSKASAAFPPFPSSGKWRKKTQRGSRCDDE